MNATEEDAKRRAQKFWGRNPAGSSLGKGLSPGTPEFFDAVVRTRTAGEQAWLPEVVDFPSFDGKALLEIGCGAGYDALHLSESGADYFGIDLARENPERTKRHLAPHGFHPRLATADAEALPFRSESFEVAFSNGVLHHTPGLSAALLEAARVLRPGGKLWLIVYHRNSVFYRLTLVLVEHWFRGGFRERSIAERLAQIENPQDATAGSRPLVHVYGRRELKRLLREAGFVVASTWVRKLARDDMPNLNRFNRLWSLVPDSVLDAVGRVFGWYLIALGTKS